MTNIEEEIWKDVVGYEGKYQISTSGVVKSIQRRDSKNHRIVNERILRQFYCGRGRDYLFVGLYNENVVSRVLIHRLVAIHFIPNPKNYPQVNHKDRNKSNNHYSNLEWCTATENATHSNSGTGSSKYTGVYWSNQKKLWSSEICVNWVKVRLGHYSSEIQASIAYKNALKYYGIQNKYAT